MTDRQGKMVFIMKMFQNFQTTSSETHGSLRVVPPSMMVRGATHIQVLVLNDARPVHFEN